MPFSCTACQVWLELFPTGGRNGLSFICRKELDNSICDTHNEIQQVSQVLAGYESIGMGFDSLVEEYTKLCDEVENKTWAVRELKHSLEKDWCHQ